MSEEQSLDFGKMLDEYESDKTIRNGAVVEGQVIDVKPDVMYLNIGYKIDGMLTREEYSSEVEDLREVAAPGDTLEVKVVKVNDGDGQVILSYRRLAAEKGNQRLEEAFENKEVLTAKVTQVRNGGLSVTVDEARVFIPASLVSDGYERDLTKYQDQDIEFVITEFNPRRHRIIGDRKQILLARKKEAAKELFEKIGIGDEVEGTIKNVTDFGAFIDLGGADGLLHISEMSWGHVDSPKKVFKVGETLRVLIKDINGEKIALSLKFPDQNPWLGAEDKYAAGTVVKGKIARMTDFGAFVELEPGIDALLHVSQIAREHIDKPSDVLKSGQEIEAKVVELNAADHKISLSMKALLPELPPEPKEEEASSEESVESIPVADEAAPTLEVPEEVEAAVAEEAPAEEAAAEEAVAEEAPAEEAAAEEAVAEEAVAEEAPAEEAVADEAPTEDAAE